MGDELDVEGCAALIVGMVASWPISLVEGALLMQFWRWFVRGAFHALPPLGFWPAVGLAYAFGFLTMDVLFAMPDPPKRTAGEWWKKAEGKASTLGLFLFFGWLLHLLIVVSS